MASLYRRQAGAGFGNGQGESARAKPLKRPSQRRAKFTVQAIYEAFVRIWRRDGAQAATTRAVALEAGCSVGTLYEYFPNKEALLSGYVRHTIEVLLARIQSEVTERIDASWTARVRHLVRLSCGDPALDPPYFDHAMLMREDRIAEPKHHLRFFDELSTAWRQALDACPDLPARPDDALVQTMLQAIWGARRYRVLLQDGPPATEVWISEMERLCLRALAATPEVV
ncbi:TetR/AcrR family transcriptional regulator [Ralstonia sp. CHL-2022]|uniref:TetR/AcrR family transcriptional regulator n=1 Tax=Ralstonia mojiangensis TaxID=2953895 RepID=A0AAE3HYX5_9RALS|nr:TetR/AcrR family transcriptional regulator [Ralstonia mojiangensis]MCT7295964.1 TetR/AcrR family transcriptional regulator [Ralstonia mojiangensis]MCT7310437.1 TetR/AcrR family transcriptional regulator [Ralstonia mojiangensis]MCT7314564.1 TetR/AcrR family transcriptional regulator [Ralstonia mojiangensis]MCT7326578.1 TetR/AcrR family transcriptional regulator [Ralstonia mojiangensis]